MPNAETSAGSCHRRANGSALYSFAFSRSAQRCLFDTDKRMLDELKVRVDNFWSERIKKGDPLQQKTQTAKVGCLTQSVRAE